MYYIGVYKVHVRCSAEVELSSLKQRLEEATAVSQALRLELQLTQRLERTASDDDDKENSRGWWQYSLTSSSSFVLTLWCLLLPYGYSNFWRLGTLTLSRERQSAQMSKITNDGLTRSGTG